MTLFKYFMAAALMVLWGIGGLAAAETHTQGPLSERGKKSAKPGMEATGEKSGKENAPQQTGQIQNPTPLHFLSEELDQLFGTQY